MGRILYHGGPRGLQPGDTIEGGHTRRMHDNCPLCRMHAKNDPTDPDYTQHPEHAYCTPIKIYARQYAALCAGDLYQVRPADGHDLMPGDEPDIEEYRCDQLIVVRCVERHVTLTWKDRRKLQRWMQTLPGYKPGPDHLARNASAHMLNQWQAQQIAQAQALADRHQ